MNSQGNSASHCGVPLGDNQKHMLCEYKYIPHSEVSMKWAYVSTKEVFFHCICLQFNVLPVLCNVKVLDPRKQINQLRDLLQWKDNYAYIITQDSEDHETILRKPTLRENPEETTRVYLHRKAFWSIQVEKQIRIWLEQGGVLPDCGKLACAITWCQCTMKTPLAIAPDPKYKST